jgi:hypothetical protein
MTDCKLDSSNPMDVEGESARVWNGAWRLQKREWIEAHSQR